MTKTPGNYASDPINKITNNLTTGMKLEKMEGNNDGIENGILTI